MSRSEDFSPRSLSAIGAHGGRACGYSIVELLVAMGLAVSILGSAYGLVSGWQIGFGAEAERADVQQRLRVAVGVLATSLMQAGAGTQSWRDGWLAAMPIAWVLPFEIDADAAGAPAAVRPDAITILRESAGTSARTTLRMPLAAQSGDAVINLDVGCPPAESACGFVAETTLLVFDDTGSFDTYRVEGIDGDTLRLRHTMADSGHVYPPGASVIAGGRATLRLNTDPTTGVLQLVRSDAAGDAPIVDHLVALRFEYFGDPAPPAILDEGSGATPPSTTYGPRPPPLAVRLDGQAAGENCAFAVDASAPRHVPRLSRLGDGSAALVRLDSASLGDGPWCPDASAANRYDADLLRVRRIAVTLRVEAAWPAQRGPAGVLFAHGGTSRTAAAWVRDQEIRFDIAPRHLNLTR